MKIPIRFYYDLDASLRFYCALAVSATIRVILTKISNRSGMAIQWIGGLRKKENWLHLFSYVLVVL